MCCSQREGDIADKNGPTPDQDDNHCQDQWRIPPPVDSRAENPSKTLTNDLRF